MIDRSTRWTRRQFSQALAASAATPFLGWPSQAATHPPLHGLAFVASESASSSNAHGEIQVFRVEGHHWHSLQTLSAASPAHLEPHATLPILYVVHNVQVWDHLPRGAVSAYRIALQTGTLALLNTQPLSLSATSPRHASVTPDGSHLLVAAEHGGIYNLLPIAADGRLQPPSAIRKDIDLSEDATGSAAAPRHLIVHPNGTTAVVADAGHRSIALFHAEPDALHLLHRSRSDTAATPNQLALSPSGQTVYTLHADQGVVTVHRLEADRLAPIQDLQIAPTPNPSMMTMHPKGRYLIVASQHKLTALAIDSRTGRLSISSTSPHREPLRSIIFDPTGASLLAAKAASGNILHIAFDTHSGAFGTARTVAQHQGASSLLFRSATVSKTA